MTVKHLANFRHAISALAALGLWAAAALPAAAAGKVEVSFVEPEKFADAGRSVVDRERTLKALGEYLQGLGRELPDGQTLQIEVTDLDLAGNVDPFGWNGIDDVRVLRGRADWPHVYLRFKLLAQGRELRAGEAHITDISYLYSLRGRESRSDMLAYEKQMVRRWFDETFVSR